MSYMASGWHSPSSKIPPMVCLSHPFEVGTLLMYLCTSEMCCAVMVPLLGTISHLQTKYSRWQWQEICGMRLFPLVYLVIRRPVSREQGFPDPVGVHLFINPSGSSSPSWSPCTLAPASPSARSSADPPSAVGKPSLFPCLEPPVSLNWWPRWVKGDWQ